MKQRALGLLRRNWRAAVVVVVIAVVGAGVYLRDRSHANEVERLRRLVSSLRWEVAQAQEVAGEDHIAVDVGTIQFLRRGYSITLSSAEYRSEGLVLTGEIGNPTMLWLSALTLNLSARRPVRRAAPPGFVLEEPGVFPVTMELLDRLDPIGVAQAKVPVVMPGSTAEFRATIPNVRQTSEGIDLVVWFSGERYSYRR